MPYGQINTDTIQSSTTGTAPVFKDGSGNQIGTLCRAWVNFNGVTTATIRASFNVSSVTRQGTGDYRVYFVQNMPDANYSVVGSSGGQSSTSNGAVYLYDQAMPRAVSAFALTTLTPAGGAADTPQINVAVFR